MSNGYREKCLEEKGEECHFCSESDDIEVHHIDGDRANNNIENLLPVCTKHHKDIHLGRDGFEEWFEQLSSTSQRPYRKPDGFNSRMTFSVSEGTYEQVSRLSEKLDVSQSEITRRLVNRGLQPESEWTAIDTGSIDRNQPTNSAKVDRLETELDLYKRQVEKYEQMIDYLTNYSSNTVPSAMSD